MNHMIQINSIRVDFHILLFQILLRQGIDLAPELLRINAVFLKNRVLHIPVH